MYTVSEGDGAVELCVNLTKPGEDIDIGDEVVVVSTHDYTSMHIPAGAALAGEWYYVWDLTILAHIFLSRAWSF